MRTTWLTIDASRAEVFATLSDGWTYTSWVVGASHMRAVDAEWPAPGSRIHHVAGVWPLIVRDETQVAELEPERRVVLIARGRPFGEAKVVIELEDDSGGCRVGMAESVVRGPGRWLPTSVMDALFVKRNREALERLAAMVERRTVPK